MEDIIYFDNAATTQMCGEAIKAVTHAFTRYGNPSSLHGLGVEAKSRLELSRKKIEKVLKINDGAFYFTSGATESNNLAIKGAANANKRRGKHIITTLTEHPSVLEPVKSLEKDGFTVSCVTPLNDGTIDKEQLLSHMRDDTALVSIMHVNNETGAKNDVEQIAQSVKRNNINTVIHVDAVCSFCKIPLNIKNIDLLSVSGHKLHAPKGIGGIYIKKGIKITPLIMGGGQESGMRSGTENTAFIEAFAASAEMCANSISENYALVANLKEIMLKELLHYDFAEVIGSAENSSPYILTIGFKGYKSQIILNALAEKNIFVSAGSACSSNKKNKSKSITALSIDDALVDGSIRFSFSKYNTLNDVNRCLEALSSIFKTYKGLI